MVKNVHAVDKMRYFTAIENVSQLSIRRFPGSIPRLLINMKDLHIHSMKPRVGSSQYRNIVYYSGCSDDVPALSVLHTPAQGFPE